MKTIMLVILFLLTFGCSDEISQINATDETIEIDEINIDEFKLENLNSSQISLVRAGAKQWCDASDGRYCPVIIEDGESTIVGDSIPACGRWSPQSNGSSLIILDIYQDDERFLVGVLHEFAHHFGCTHYVEESTGLLPQWVRDVTNIGVTDAVVNCQRLTPKTQNNPL